MLVCVDFGLKIVRNDVVGKYKMKEIDMHGFFGKTKLGLLGLRFGCWCLLLDCVVLSWELSNNDDNNDFEGNKWLVVWLGWIGQKGA